MNELNLLACGPYFAPGGLLASLLVLGVAKPVCYFAFIRAFRYRVNRDIPMAAGQAARLALLRFLLGIPLIIVGYMLTATVLTHSGSFALVSIAWLSSSRMLVWYLLGSFWVALTGRRLLAWTCFGTLMNLMIDGAFALGLAQGPVGLAVILGPAVLISILDVRGSRRELRERFDGAPRCAVCQYNLTGNLSGICPECGTAIEDRAPTEPALG